VIFRQAVLKKAFDGFDKVPFEKIVTSSQNGLAKRSGTEGREIKVLRLADITNLAIDNSSPRSIILSDKELEKYQLHEGDLLAIRVNGSIDLVGRFIHVTNKDEIEEWAFCDHLIRVTLDKEKCVSTFYYYFFQLQQVRKFIHQNMVSSAGQNTVSQGTVKSIPVPLTSIERQHQIVKEIESRLSVCDTVEQSITESLEKAKALRQSILKKAFEGTLLSEEELSACKAAKDYEPASVLLKKIKAEKKK
jgi:type I restriction enzyme S subunit